LIKDSRRYLLDPENWVEMCMIALICTILFAPATDNNRDMKRHLAAIRHAILQTETPSGILSN
jgi:hypothetical protein